MALEQNTEPNETKSKKVTLRRFFPRKKKLIFAGVCVLLVLGIGVTAAFRLKQGKQTVMQLPEVSTVQRGDLSQRVTATGTVVAADPVSIFIELSQEVETVYAEVGDTVEAGQLLVTYDTADTKKDLQNKLADAKVNLENAQLALSELTAPAEGTSLIELEAQVVQAKKTLADAQKEQESYDIKLSQAQTTVNTAKKTMEDNAALLTVGGVSQSTYDDSEINYDKAVADLQQLQMEKETKGSAKESAVLALSKAELLLAQGKDKGSDAATANAIKKQQNAVETASRNVATYTDELGKLSEATYSPISGTVIESNAVEGQMLTDSTVMMKVADLTNLDVEAYVSEYDIAQISVGQKVEMTSDGIEGVTYAGTVTKIDPMASTQSTVSGSETVVPIVVHMEAPDARMKPGFSLDLEVIVQDLSDATYVPLSAVSKEEDGSHFVFVVGTNNTLTKTAVTLGSYTDVSAEITDGLSEGTRVITSPQETMTDGSLLQDYGTAKPKTEEETGNSLLPGGGGMPGGGGGMQGGGMPGGGMPGGSGGMQGGRRGGN